MDLWNIAFCISVILYGCVIILPSNDSIGEPKKFEKDGLTITLTDRFKEQESQVGFDAYYTASFGAVMVLKDSGNLRYYSYCFKVTDAFWIVQFGCYLSQLATMEDQIFLWAKSVEVE